MRAVLAKLGSIKTPLWGVWLMWVLITCSHLDWTLTYASFGVALGTELFRYGWRDMLADLKTTYWWNRMAGR